MLSITKILLSVILTYFLGKGRVIVMKTLNTSQGRSLITITSSMDTWTSMQIKQMNSMYILDLTSKVYMLKVLIVIVNNIIDE